MVKLIDGVRQVSNPNAPSICTVVRMKSILTPSPRSSSGCRPSDDGRIIKLEYCHCEHLGTPIALSDLKGNIIWRAKYDPWGNVLEEYNPDNTEQLIRFQSQQYDEESWLH